MNKTLSVGIGATVIYESAGPEMCLPVPLTVAVYPGSGGTVVVNQRVAATGEWKAISDGYLTGTLSANATAVLDGPIQALKFTAATAAATIEIAAP